MAETVGDQETPMDLSKVLRLHSTLENLRTELRDLDADEAALQRLATIHNEIESQLALALPVDLRAELAELSSCCQGNPSPSKPEIRMAQAQVIGWIEGLLQGVQLTMAAARGATAATLAEAEPASEQSEFGPNSYL